MRLFSFLLLMSIFMQQGIAQSKPESTDIILKKAYTQAKKEKKNVLVMFHASWCGWCKRMDKTINDEVCKVHFDKNYVIVHLDVLERGEKEALENAGAEEFMNKNGGEGQGLPYWIVLDNKGTLLADSKMRPEGADLSSSGQNTGCPASEEEVKHLVAILKKTSKIKATALEAIAGRFKKNAE